MDVNVDDYRINNPVFVRLKRKFDLFGFSYRSFVKRVFINERIVELPFVIHGLAGIAKGSRILDLGCSESILPLQLAGLGYQVTGLDVRRYPYFSPGFVFLQVDATELPMKDNEYSVVTCISMLEHVGLGHYKDPLHDDLADSKVLKEVRRVLAPGGRIFLTVPFGLPAIGELQRTYDRNRLEKVLSGFTVEEIRFCINDHSDGCLNDYWRECSEEEAAKVDSVEKTSCVCLIKAVNGKV